MVKKLITYITNYEGNKKINHLNEIIESLSEIDVEYHKVKIFTTETLPIESNKLDIEILQHPRKFSNSRYKNKWQPEPNFIWLHRKHVMKDQDDYDVFCHLEDDIKLTKNNFDSFLTENSKLPNNKVVGFLVYEQQDNVKKIVSMHLGGFKRYINSFEEINDIKYFTPENLHSACWILEKRNLKKAISLGINAIPNIKNGKYNIKCTACTEFYLKIKKVIPTKTVDNFLIQHLTNKYFNNNGKLKSITLNELKPKI